MGKRVAVPVVIAGVLALWLWGRLQGEGLAGLTLGAADAVERAGRGRDDHRMDAERESLGQSSSRKESSGKSVDARARSSLRLRVLAAESGLPVGQVLMHGPRCFGSHPGSELVLENVRPGAFELTISAPGRIPRRIETILEPGRMRDLGDVRLAKSLAIRGIVHGPDDRSAKGSLLVLGRFLPEQGVVTWTENRWVRSGPGGHFLFEEIAPGRYLLRCDRIDDPLASGDFLHKGSAGVWIDVLFRDVDDVRIDLESMVEVIIPGRPADAETHSLRIHDESGYELRSEWVLSSPHSVWLVRGRYEVAWWSNERELGRLELYVRDESIQLELAF